MPGQECNTNTGVPILENYQLTPYRIHRGAATHAVFGTTVPPQLLNNKNNGVLEMFLKSIIL